VREPLRLPGSPPALGRREGQRQGMLALAPRLPTPHPSQELPPAHAHRLRTRRRAGAIVLVLAALGGCASLSPEHQRGLAEVRELADAIARAYDAPTIPVMVGASTPGLAGTDRRGLFPVGG